jgi:predicted dehydrogenase
VDEQSAYLLRYSDGRVSLLSSAVAVDLYNRADIIGTEGRIAVPPGFHKSPRVELHRNGEEPVVGDHPPVEQDGFKHEIAEVVSCLRAGRTESAAMPLDETVRIMETIDEVKRQLGLVYENDRRGI